MGSRVMLGSFTVCVGATDLASASSAVEDRILRTRVNAPAFLGHEARRATTVAVAIALRVGGAYRHTRILEYLESRLVMLKGLGVG